jgi:A nuclease of the HNH/ENDO VII superfamily with conserved WHH
VKHVTPGLKGGVSSKPPPGLTWHHVADREGVLQLVPFEEHSAAGPVQKSLHPEGKGGRANWGGGKDARK